MNFVLNDNWKQIFEDMRGPVEAALSDAFRSIVEKVVENVPYGEIFPQNCNMKSCHPNAKTVEEIREDLLRCH